MKPDLENKIREVTNEIMSSVTDVINDNSYAVNSTDIHFSYQTETQGDQCFVRGRVDSIGGCDVETLKFFVSSFGMLYSGIKEAVDEVLHSQNYETITAEMCEPEKYVHIDAVKEVINKMLPDTSLQNFVLSEVTRVNTELPNR